MTSVSLAASIGCRLAAVASVTSPAPDPLRALTREIGRPDVVERAGGDEHPPEVPLVGVEGTSGKDGLRPRLGDEFGGDGFRQRFRYTDVGYLELADPFRAGEVKKSELGESQRDGHIGAGTGGVDIAAVGVHPRGEVDGDNF